MAMPEADISYDRFHVVAMAIQTMDDVRRQELRTEPEEVAAGAAGRRPKDTAQPAVGYAHEPRGWTEAQTTEMYWLQRSALKGA